jgi:hypothetical protein
MSSGSTSVVTLSNKRVIKTNKCLKLEEFLVLSADGKRKRWQWAFNSDAAKAVAKILEEHMDFVEEAHALAVDNKRKKKEKKALDLEKFRGLLGIVLPPPHFRLVAP